MAVDNYFQSDPQNAQLFPTPDGAPQICNTAAVIGSRIVPDPEGASDRSLLHHELAPFGPGNQEPRSLQANSLFLCRDTHSLCDFLPSAYLRTFAEEDITLSACLFRASIVPYKGCCHRRRAFPSLPHYPFAWTIPRTANGKLKILLQVAGLRR